MPLSFDEYIADKRKPLSFDNYMAEKAVPDTMTAESPMGATPDTVIPFTGGFQHPAPTEETAHPLNPLFELMGWVKEKANIRMPGTETEVLGHKFPGDTRRKLFEPIPNPEDDLVLSITNALKGFLAITPDIPQFFGKDIPEATVGTFTPESQLGAEQPTVGRVAEQMGRATIDVMALAVMRQLHPEEYKRFIKTDRGKAIRKMESERLHEAALGPLIFSGGLAKAAKVTGKLGKAKPTGIMSDIIPKERIPTERVPILDELLGVEKAKVPVTEKPKAKAVKKTKRIRDVVAPKGEELKLTQDEYVSEHFRRTGGPHQTAKIKAMLRKDHQSIVEQALSENRPVSDAVMADYPYLDYLRPEVTPKPKLEVAKSEVKAKAKEPWETDLRTYHALEMDKLERAGRTEQYGYTEVTSRIHRESVEQALSENKPVPAEVLKDYPELGKEPSIFKNPLGRDAFAYLENVDRIKGLAKRQKGAEYVSDIKWLSDTDILLRRAFEKEKKVGELFGDYLQRISGRSIKPKSLPFAEDYPALQPKAPPTRAKAEVAETLNEYVERKAGPEPLGIQVSEAATRAWEKKKWAAVAEYKTMKPSERGAVLNIPKEIARPGGAEPVKYKEAIKTPDRPEMANMESYYKSISTQKKLTPDQAVKEGIALKTTPGFKVKPAVREAGTFVPKDFAAYENFKDAKQGIGGGTKDWIRYVQEIDGALSLQKKAKLSEQAGPAEKYILRRTEDMMMIEFDWSAEQSLRIKEITKGLSGKQERLVTEVLEETSRPGAYVKTADFATNARIKKITTDTKIVKAAQESRKLLEHMFAEQNRLRALRNQELIDYRQYYAPEILRQASLWERAFGGQKKAREVIKGPQLPDYIKPNKPFNPRELAREIGIPNFMREMRIGKILEDYANTASRDIHHTSIIQNNKAFIQQLERMGYKNAAEGIGNFTAESFGGVKPRLDRAFDFPVKVQKGMRFWRGSLMRSVFPLNFTWNTTVQTLSSGLTVMRTGITNSTRGLVDWFTNPAMRNRIKSSYSYRVKSQRGGRITRQDINTGVTEMVRGRRSVWQAAIDGANYATELVERHLTGWSIASGLRHGAKRGLKGKPLWDYASDTGAKTQSMYNLENKPGIIRSETVQTAAPFQTFIFEMYNTAKEFAGKTGTPPGAMTERIGWVLRFTAAAYAGNEMAHAVTGRRPWEIYSFIPFSDQTIKPMVNALRGKEYQTTARGLPSFVGAGVEFWRGVRSYLKTGDTRKMRQWGLKYGTAFMKIPGGTQIARMVDGWIAVANEGMKDARGRTQFKITDPWEKVRAVTMGPYRTKAGIEYWDKRKTNILDDILGKPKKKKRKSILTELSIGG